jgi:hypothetical protein
MRVLSFSSDTKTGVSDNSLNFNSHIAWPVVALCVFDWVLFLEFSMSIFYMFSVCSFSSDSSLLVVGKSAPVSCLGLVLEYLQRNWCFSLEPQYSAGVQRLPWLGGSVLLVRLPVIGGYSEFSTLLLVLFSLELCLISFLSVPAAYLSYGSWFLACNFTSVYAAGAGARSILMIFRPCRVICYNWRFTELCFRGAPYSLSLLCCWIAALYLFVYWAWRFIGGERVTGCGSKREFPSSPCEFTHTSFKTNFSLFVNLPCLCVHFSSPVICPGAGWHGSFMCNFPWFSLSWITPFFWLVMHVCCRYLFKEFRRHLSEWIWFLVSLHEAVKISFPLFHLFSIFFNPCTLNSYIRLTVVWTVWVSFGLPFHFFPSLFAGTSVCLFLRVLDMF